MASKDKQTKITFHAGILTIGGTVIEVAYGDAHIFFDFGTEFRPELKLEDNRLQTLLENRLVPDLAIYDPKLGYESSMMNDYAYTAVFISHCHLDHTRMMNYLDPEIPMYALKETKVLLEALNRDNDFVLPYLYPSAKTTRDIIGLDNRQVVQIGEISVEVLRVDHDAYGAMGLKISCPDKTVTYTGDLRLHGLNPEDTLSFCKANQKTDVLIMEGVSVSFEGEREPRPYAQRFDSEDALIAAIFETVKLYENKPASFNVYPANLLRVKRLAEQSPRTVVLTDTLAQIMKDVFDMDCYYYETGKTKHRLNSQFKKEYDIITSDGGSYFWQYDGQIEAMRKGGVYIHSDASPLGEFDPAFLPFVQGFSEKGIEFRQMTCSGHAFPEDLKKIISLIQPKLLVPIHTLRPEVLENPYGERCLPIRGETI